MQSWSQGMRGDAGEENPKITLMVSRLHNLEEDMLAACCTALLSGP